MLGRLALGVMAAGLTPSKPPRNVKHKKPQGVGGCITVLGIIVCVTIFVIGDATHTWTVLWFITVPLICAAIIGIGQLTQAAGRQHRMETAVRNLPDAKPEIVTVRGMREQAAELKRTRRVAGVLGTRCSMCGSVPGVSCAMTPGVVIYLLDAKRDLYAHGIRIQRAISEGTATLDDVIAQFDGSVPESLLASLL